MSLTVEESNFLRFYYLNLKVATKAVRVYFDHIHRQGRLEWKLKENETHLKSLDNLITSHQINIVYPSSGHIVNSDQFDTTLMICLLRNMKPYTVEYANDKGWDKFPPATDTSYLADLARVKWYRNFVSHHKGELTAADFNWHCRNLEPAIGRLGGQTLLIEARSAQHVILDTSLKDMLLELRNCEKSLQGMTDKINSHQLSLDLLTTNEEELVEKIHKMEAETQELTTKLSDYKGTIDACTKELETCKNDIKTNKEIMKGLQNQSDKKQNDIENLITRIDKLEIEYEQHDKMLKEHGEHLVMHDGQVIQLQEHLVMHDGQLEKCEKQIHDIKEKQHDTDVTSEDTKALIEADVREDTFVYTKAVKDALSMLKENGVLVITGHAGTGKSRIGRHILHMICTDDTSYKYIKLNTLEEWEDMSNRDENVAVLIDDIFGETNCIYYRKNAIPILDKVHSYVCKGNIKVIITIRDTVKRQCQEVFDSHRLFQFDFIDLSSDKYVLSQEEKLTILTKYMQIARQSDLTDNKEFLDSKDVTILDTIEVWKIIQENPVKGFPLVVYQFVHNDKYFKLGCKFFDSPTKAMLEEMNEIRSKGKEHMNFMIQYAVMVYTAINENYIDPDDEKSVTEVIKIIEAIYGKAIEPRECDLSDAVKYLRGSYLINVPNQCSYKFHHPTLQETVILSFAKIKEQNIDKIIHLISWSFFLKMVKPKLYHEKEGEVVLKIPTNSYKRLAYRLVDTYRASSKRNRLSFSNMSDTEMFQQDYCCLLHWLLEALENEDKKDDKDTYADNMIQSGETDWFYKIQSNCVPIRHKAFFLANLLNILSESERQFDIYHFVLGKFNETFKTSNDYMTIGYMEAALIKSFYKICSTKGIRCVKATLDVIEEHNIPVLLDQSINITQAEMLLLRDVDRKPACAFLELSIWKAYKEFNIPVLEFLLSKYIESPFDFNLFMKKFYREEWMFMPFYSTTKFDWHISEKSFKWMIERCPGQKFIDTDYLIIQNACRYQMFYMVEYLAPSYKTLDVYSCLKAFVDGCKLSYPNCNCPCKQEIFNFLLNKIDISSQESIPFLRSVIQEHYVPDYLCDVFLLVCLNNADILTLACNNGHFYLVNLIIESSHIEHLDIQSALMAACKKPGRNIDYLEKEDFDIGQLKIVKYIVDKNRLEQFDLKAACRQACSSGSIKIIEWLVQNIDTTRLDVYCIIKSALVFKRLDILEYIIRNDENCLKRGEVLNSIFEHYTAECSTAILELVSSIWCSTMNKEVLHMNEIVNTAYDKKCFELLMWIHDNCHPHVSIDSKKVLMLACEDNRIDVAKWVLQTFEQTSLKIDRGELFMIACTKCDFRTDIIQEHWIDMINWILASFEIKGLNIISGVLKLIRTCVDINIDISYLVVSILKKYLTYLNTKDVEEMIDIILEKRCYVLMNWFLENKGYSYDLQTILNKTCQDAEIDTLTVLSKYFDALDMNQAMTNACIPAAYRYNPATYDDTDYNDDRRVACLNMLLKKIDTIKQNSIAIQIVSKICEMIIVSHNVMTWILLNLPLDQILMNKVLIACCQQGKIHHVKYIVHAEPYEKLGIKEAFVEACRAAPVFVCNHYNSGAFVENYVKMKYNEPNYQMIVDYLFQMTNDKDSYLSLVVNELLEKENFELILYFLEKGYCRDINMTNLFKDACLYGYVRLVQWILENVEHKELDIKSAFHKACVGYNIYVERKLNHVKCLGLMWHYIHDRNMFEIDTVLNKMAALQTETSVSGHENVSYLCSDDGLTTWLLTIKKMKQKLCRSDKAILQSDEIGNQ
ncbi:uncharacterized protein LOC143074995 isoform X2 [Mytilus galloprovincialis]|uniref:uncharacterized protein LOC143074995 isoform X2 n=1 Tax=Mytilus galloprovincialis TaxID=29158 RepID=UPI003F7C19F5